MILVLASESAYRRQLLDRLQLPYRACSHTLDERSYAQSLPSDHSLPERALALARAKAESLAPEVSGAHILASDQIAELNGEVLHKPGTRARAIAQLSQLQGVEHRLHTAVALRLPSGEMLTCLDEHRMRMRPLSLAEIERYIDSDKPLDCCGSYKIESLGISLFERIDGDDFTAITGLPLLGVSQLLRRAGFQLP